MDSLAGMADRLPHVVTLSLVKCVLDLCAKWYMVCLVRAMCGLYINPTPSSGSNKSGLTSSYQ